MSEDKFTPGPWRHVINRPPLIMGPEGEEIAVVKRNERCSYNAALIAAAPEMYAALKNAIEYLAIFSDGTAREIGLRGLEILKKARGEE